MVNISDDRRVLVDGELELNQSTTEECVMETSMDTPSSESIGGNDSPEQDEVATIKSDISKSEVLGSGEDPLTSTSSQSTRENSPRSNRDGMSRSPPLQEDTNLQTKLPKSALKATTSSTNSQNTSSVPKVVVLKRQHPPTNSRDPQPNERIDEILEVGQRSSGSETSGSYTSQKPKHQHQQHFRY